MHWPESFWDDGVINCCCCRVEKMKKGKKEKRKVGRDQIYVVITHPFDLTPPLTPSHNNFTFVPKDHDSRLTSKT